MNIIDLPQPDREHFNNDQEYYLQDVKSWLKAWYYYTVMDYLKWHTPLDLEKETYLANIEKFYNIYVQHCIDHNIVAMPRREAFEWKEIQEILERWNDVYAYTEFDPDIKVKIKDLESNDA